MNKSTAMIEFQWISNHKYYEHYSIGQQFNQWVLDNKLNTDTNFKVVSSNVISSRNDEGKTVETLFVIYEYSTTRY
jgi:hypothetical protein